MHCLLLEEAENTADYQKGIFGHAEFNLVHRCAPCERCLGAIISLGIQTVVFGVSYKELSKLTPSNYVPIDREGLLKQLGIKLQLIGPVLEDDGMYVFEYWAVNCVLLEPPCREPMISAKGFAPIPQGKLHCLRSASVGAKPTSTGRRAPLRWLRQLPQADARHLLWTLPSGDTLLHKLFPSDKFVRFTISCYTFSAGKSIMFSAKKSEFEVTDMKMLHRICWSFYRARNICVLGF